MKRELNPKTLSRALIHLAKVDKELHYLIKLKENLTLYKRPLGFEGLINLIVEQQLSVASAKAIFNRVKSNISPLTAEKLLMTRFPGIKVKVIPTKKTPINVPGYLSPAFQSSRQTAPPTKIPNSKGRCVTRIPSSE